MSQLIQVATGNIKSIQRGTVTAANGSTGTVVISDVNMDSSVLSFSCRNGYAVSFGGYAGHATMASIFLSAVDSLTWKGGVAFNSGAGYSDSLIEWELVEYF